MLLKIFIRGHLFKLCFCSSVKFHGFLCISPMTFCMLNHFLCFITTANNSSNTHSHIQNKFSYLQFSYFNNQVS